MFLLFFSVRAARGRAGAQRTKTAINADRNFLFDQNYMPPQEPVSPCRLSHPYYPPLFNQELRTLMTQRKCINILLIVYTWLSPMRVLHRNGPEKTSIFFPGRCVLLTYQARPPAPVRR